MIRQLIGKVEVIPAVVPELANNNGGCTILANSTDDPEVVEVRVAWCRFTDNYCRAIGRKIAESKEPMFVRVDELKQELEGIEEQMLVQCAWPTRHDEELMKDCIGDWSRAAAHFAKKEKKIAVASENA
jgi:hypothetical protein